MSHNNDKKYGHNIISQQHFTQHTFVLDEQEKLFSHVMDQRREMYIAILLDIYHIMKKFIRQLQFAFNFYQLCVFYFS